MWKSKGIKTSKMLSWLQMGTHSLFPPTCNLFRPCSLTQFWTVLSITTKIKLVQNPESWFSAPKNSRFSFRSTLCWWRIFDPHTAAQNWWKCRLVEHQGSRNLEPNQLKHQSQFGGKTPKENVNQNRFWWWHSSPTVKYVTSNTEAEN